MILITLRLKESERTDVRERGLVFNTTSLGGRTNFEKSLRSNGCRDKKFKRKTSRISMCLLYCK